MSNIKLFFVNERCFGVYILFLISRLAGQPKFYILNRGWFVSIRISPVVVFRVYVLNAINNEKKSDLFIFVFRVDVFCITHTFRIWQVNTVNVSLILLPTWRFVFSTVTVRGTLQGCCRCRRSHCPCPRAVFDLKQQKLHQRKYYFIWQNKKSIRVYIKVYVFSGLVRCVIFMVNLSG